MAKPIPANPVADLPENWTGGQIVAPNGADVGLSEKHGYNYQSSKINEALRDIGILNDAFAEIQDAIKWDGNYNAETNKGATVSTVTNAIGALDVASVGGAGKYISAISETDGKISATVSDIANTYSAAGTAPISGKGVAAAIEALDVAAINGAASKTITSISETDGKISATYSDIAIGAGQITSGTLPVARGGTGLTASPSILTNLGSTAADTVLKASPRPGVTGTLPVANGGTGATSVNPNLIFSGPASGSAAAPAFRSLAAADIPNIDTAKLTSGTLPVARGGTGQTSVENIVAGKIRDSYNGKDITASYGATALTTASYLAAWNGYSIGAIAAATAKTVIGLGNAENKSSATIRGELTKANVTTALGYTPATSSNMTGATDSAAGAAGLVPAPAKGAATRYLRSDGTWQVPPNTTYAAGTGISLSGTTFANSGVRSISSGSANGTISVNTNGTAANVAVKGLAALAYKASLAAADIPNIDTAKLTSGTLGEARGGTGVAAWTGTDYTTSRPRAIAFATATPTSIANGRITLVYS